MGKSDGGPAFPVSTGSKGNEVSGPYGHQDSVCTWQFPGLTIRDYFAAKAMHAVITSQPNLNRETVSAAAYGMADAMIRERDA